MKNAAAKTEYAIGRVYNRHGVSDYYIGNDEDGTPMFSGKKHPRVAKYTNHNTAYGMTIRLKRLLPTIIGGFPASYEVMEIAQSND
jgi:hypothetical protein